MKHILIVSLITVICVNYLHSQSPWETTNLPNTANFADIDFINANTGFAATTGGGNARRVFMTSNKGNNWSLLYSTTSAQTIFYAASTDFINENVGFYAFDSMIIKITNGSGAKVFSFPMSQALRIRFVSPDTGYLVISRLTKGISIYKTINGGNNWSITSVDNIFSGTNITSSIVYDIDFSKNDHNKLYAVGKVEDNNVPNFTPLHIRTSNGFTTYSYEREANNSYHYSFDHISFLPNDSIRILGTLGIYGLAYNGNPSLRYSTSHTQTTVTPEFAMTFANNEIGYMCLNNGNLFRTSNSGFNWTNEIDIDLPEEEFQGDAYSKILTFGDIVYFGNPIGNSFYTRKLTIDLKTFFDDVSVSGQFYFDGTSYNTPTTQTFRGGYSELTCSNLLNSGQSNERIFYKWNDGFMSSDHAIIPYYFDIIGGTTANYYKTRQLSNISSSIANASQSKSIRDTTLNGVTMTHTIHESMEGIFYSKSTNYGATYQTEEVVNKGYPSEAFGNKNASICITRNFSGSTPITPYDANRNVVVVWEHYNSSSQKIEIKVAHRILNANQTGYEWQRIDSLGQDYFTAFSASSTFESKPKCIAIAPFDHLQNPNNFTIIIPHLRPNGEQFKIITTVKYNTQCQNYEIDNGDVHDLSVASPYNVGGSQIIYFAYLKGDSVSYRREGFGTSNGNVFGRDRPEYKGNIASGDGYTSRYSPDISIMDTVPVVSYSASYYAERLVEFEGGGSEYISITRYPVVKVQRYNASSWGNYIVYNSNNVQNNPDIEGSKDTKSYMINYSLGNGQFKKVVNVESYPGYFCQPSIFSGTDSRLINNSYSGLFGSNLTLLTLSPQSNLYKLDKQSFVITNISNADAFDVDNIDGVVNLDTIKYTFKLGPIFIQDDVGGIVGGTFGNGSESGDPILNGVEFNENLKSSPFVLNETQALLIGANAIYLKDNAYYSISEIPYTVTLMNKRTDTLHRVLFHDTIRAEDSIETEYLRGFFITNIPNDEDSFYVKMEVDDAFDDGDFFINPIYYDPFEPEGPSNSNGHQHIAVIFENENIPNVALSTPTEFKLSQNYPNPFNPSTNIQFDIPKDNFVKIKIYDILGKELMILMNEFKRAGSYKTTFDGSSFPSGIYFYKIEAGEFHQVKRMILVK